MRECGASACAALQGARTAVIGAQHVAAAHGQRGIDALRDTRGSASMSSGISIAATLHARARGPQMARPAVAQSLYSSKGHGVSWGTHAHGLARCERRVLAAIRHRHLTACRRCASARSRRQERCRWRQAELGARSQAQAACRRAAPDAAVLTTRVAAGAAALRWRPGPARAGQLLRMRW